MWFPLPALLFARLGGAFALVGRCCGAYCAGVGHLYEPKRQPPFHHIPTGLLARPREFFFFCAIIRVDAFPCLLCGACRLGMNTYHLC
ncbi:hypothetical protein GGS20DRAFT_553794 [Poronia punctata]|nr:hypothetical protein GGS20DRAFT_553794 [Poronia punctata]